MSEILTQDQKMKEIIQLAKTVAQSKATIVIQGESGTGKELIAKLIHRNSQRSSRPFVAINCAAIPETLLESELFGYERGAFTGAIQSKSGKFELAEGGTLLLDEISEMDIKLQAKLLRVIQQSEVDRIGGRRPIPVDVRIIATTNKNLSDCVRAGTFREDLFYRINVVNLTLPPLRERVGDVRVLAQAFVQEFARRTSKIMPVLSEESMRLLESHSWPGNVRELENVMERSAITAQNATILSRDIHIDRQAGVNLLEETNLLSKSAPASGDESGWRPGRTLDDIEKNVILEALKYHHGNRTHTARSLGISIRTLRNKLADYRRDGMSV